MVRTCSRVNRYTRSGKMVSLLFAQSVIKGICVSLSWSALSCQHCNAMVEKYQWKVTDDEDN